MQNKQIKNALDSKTEFWGICCESGKRYSQIVGKKFHISMAALDPTDTSTSAVVSLMAEHDGSQYLLCSLKKDSVLQVLLNLYFDKGENITFFLKGHGTVHLSGYYVCDMADNVLSSRNKKKAPLNKLAEKGSKANFTVSANVESSEEETSDKSDKATIKVSPAKASPAASKRALNNKSKLPKAIAHDEESSEDDSMEEDDIELISDKLISPKQKQSTSPVKKPQGKGLPEKKSHDDESSSDEDLFDDEESEEDEEDDENEGEEAQVPNMKRGHSAVESSSESSSSNASSDDSSDSEDLKAGINEIKKQLQEKKLKSAASTPVQNNKRGKKSVANDGEPDMNSSIGRTPMPKKLKSQSNLSPFESMESFVAKMKQQSKSPKKDSSQSEETSTSATKTPEKSSNTLNASAQSESAKKKKNKKKAKETSENQNTPNKTPTKQQFSHKLAGGIEYEDIRPGNGLIAKKGKLVHVYYTGQLENNKVFDSCQQGQKPFSFQLASGNVIKGWDLGIEGMKVGGKRRLKIPPNMGYGNKRSGPIPPNSTLYFTVELKAVS